MKRFINICETKKTEFLMLVAPTELQSFGAFATSEQHSFYHAEI